MRSCLEIVSMDESHEELLKNEYNPDNEYTRSHPNALNIDNGDDKRGKGTGSSGHSHWLPDCTGQLGIINYSNFDTDVSFHAGNRADNDARQTALSRSMYNKDNEYSASLVDTSMNVAEGQYKTY